MNDRKCRILEATIRSYINKAEPVGSNSLLKGHNFNCSSATIRSELSELEKEGYLTHIHTSSGRVPTDKGYRLYVDSLMQIKQFPYSDQLKFLPHIFSLGASVQDVLEQIMGIVSNIIDYTTIVVMPDIFRETLKVIHLVLVDLDKVLLVLMDSVGENREFLLTVKDEVNQDDLNKISKVLTKKLEGKPLDGINEDSFATLVSELPQFKKVLKSLGKEVKNVSRILKKNKPVKSRGISKMLTLPEFKNIEYAQKILELLEENKLLSHLLASYLANRDHKVLIGSEINVRDLEDCSIVIGSVKVDNTPVGGIGVLGPRRMAYPTIVPMIQEISQKINKYFEGQ